MKKLITLFSLSCIVTLGYTQTVNKNGTGTHTTTNKTTTSPANATTNTSGKTTYTPSNNSNAAVKQQNATPKESNVNSSNQPVKTVRFKAGNVVFKKTVEKETPLVEDNAAETDKGSNETKGEIKKVAKSPEATDYVDRNKVSPNGSTDTEVNNTNNSSNAAATGTSYTPSINDKRKISCRDYSAMNNQQRHTVLNGYEAYDLSEIKVCRGSEVNSNDKDDRLVVTCTEFSNSSDERKQHIINYPSFYNTDQLKDCEDYQKFIKK